MTTPSVIELWRGFGFRMQTLTPPRTVLGTQRVAIRCDLRARLPGMLEVLWLLGSAIEPQPIRRNGMD